MKDYLSTWTAVPFQLHDRKPSSGVMKIGPEEGRLYSQKRCDIEYRSIDEL